VVYTTFFKLRCLLSGGIVSGSLWGAINGKGMQQRTMNMRFPFALALLVGLCYAAAARDVTDDSSSTRGTAMGPQCSPLPATMVAQTVNGPVRGLVQKVSGLPIAIYRGIPFAVPPVGPLRWKAPVPLTTTWTTPIDALAYAPICPQVVATPDPRGMSENCLYTNVWAPLPLYPGETFPVMVWIHGGAFVSGAPEDFGTGNFSILAVTKRIVVVAAAYRVSAFGFYSSVLLGDSEPYARGVFGLLDQRLSLQWAKANVAFFGGDPDQMTIYGQSAGGISVCLNTVTPLNDAPGGRLFRRAIASSGYADILPVTNNSADTTLQAALGCTTIECMYAASTEAITVTAGSGFLSFQPTVGGNAFLPDQPISLMASRALHCQAYVQAHGAPCDIFMPDIFVQGFVANEGTFLLYDVFPTLTVNGPDNPGPPQAAADAVNIGFGNYTPEYYFTKLAPIYSAALNPSIVLYPGNTVIQQTDDIMACNVRNNLFYMSMATKAYGWYFDSAPATLEYPPWVKVFHESDVFFVARRCDGLWCTSLTPEQQILGTKMDDYWSAVIRQGSLDANGTLAKLPPWVPFKGPLGGTGPYVMHWTASGEGKGPQQSILYNTIVSADGGTYLYAPRCDTVGPIRAAEYGIPALSPPILGARPHLMHKGMIHARRHPATIL